MHNILIFLVVLGLVSCGSRDKEHPKISSSQKVKLLDSIKEATKHESHLFLQNDTLGVKIIFDSVIDVLSTSRMAMFREVVIKSIADQGIGEFTYLKIITAAREDERSSVTLVVNNSFLEERKSFYDKNPLLLKFYRFIINNISIRELRNYDDVISVIFENKGQETYLDLVRCVNHFYTECKMNDGTYYKDILVSVKTLALENQDLWPDYDPREIDYFLLHCDTAE